jgi:hypothetical protein
MIIETVLGPMDTKLLAKKVTHSSDGLVTTYLYKGQVVRQDTETIVEGADAHGVVGFYQPEANHGLD